ncbi:MAG: addiction module protein [Verrucomicrobiales bacterium]|jgi:putative addiction module component (TIGR02574 family)|nr:addiction module protein [Verrucomicrobiales bacterium]
MSTLAQVTHDALELPNHQRLQLAGFLLQADDGEMTPAEKAWDAEIRRRMEAFDRGEIEGIPFEEVMAEMDELLANENHHLAPGPA